MIRNLQDINIDNKRVIIRCDFNVPISDGKIEDDTRIVESLETIKYVIKRASKTIILSHLGRIKTEKDKKNNSLKIVCDHLNDLLNEKVSFYDYENDVVLNDKIILFENTRFFDLDSKKESSCDLELSKYFSSFGDVFVNDAFGTCHRKNSSNYGIMKFIPSCKGFLMQKEIEMLDKIRTTKSDDFIVILGGSKVSDKIRLIDKLIDKTSKIIITGAMAFTFFKAKGYEVGKSLVDDESIEYVKDLMTKYSDKIIFPIDFYTSTEFSNDGIKELKKIDEFNNNDIGLDIGPETIKLYSNVLKDSSIIFVNGPVGMFEFSNYSYGTKELCNILNGLNAFIVIGGGDSASAYKKFGANVSHISTGGGASIEYIEGKKLPGIEGYNEKEF